MKKVMLEQIMKPKLILCLALVLSGFFCFRAAPQNISKTNKWLDFPMLPPITNANFSITHQISVRVPTKLKIERTVDMLSVTIDTNGFEFTNLMVGTNVVTGVQENLFIYPVDEPRPTNWTGGAQGGLDFNLGTSFWWTKRDRFPQVGKNYIVEMDLAAFETDTPGGHMRIFPWSTNYEIIWQRTLKQIVK
jgi:hypothetical protein